MFKFCDPTENTSNRNLKTIFPLNAAYGTGIQQAPHTNPKKCFYRPPPLLLSQADSYQPGGSKLPASIIQEGIEWPEWHPAPNVSSRWEGADQLRGHCLCLASSTLLEKSVPPIFS